MRKRSRKRADSSSGVEEKMGARKRRQNRTSGSQWKEAETIDNPFDRYSNVFCFSDSRSSWR
jgi:hypothetical protein